MVTSLMNILAQAAPVAPQGGTDYFMQIGVAGILVMLILQMVFKFLKDMKDKKESRTLPNGEPKSDTGNYPTITQQNVSDIFKGLGDIKSLVHDLHTWHNVRDEDHVFAWYIRKSLSTSIERLNQAVGDLAEAVKKQNELLRHLAEEEPDG